MARKASPKTDTTAHLGFEAKLWLADAIRNSASASRKVILRSLREVKSNIAIFVLANCSMSSNQSGDCPARSASSKPKAKPQSLPRQRDIRRALIEGDLVDCMVALPGQLFYST